jgi:UDP-N-acetyl-D-glucosamine dehydrogenase
MRVIGIEDDPAKVAALQDGRSYISHIPDDAVDAMLRRGAFTVGMGPERMVDADVIIIAVPTPLNGCHAPDMQYVDAAVQSVARFIQHGQLVVLESTVYPGTTMERVLPELQRDGLKVGTNFFLAFSPEREDPNNPRYDIANTPKVVGGVTDRCTEVAAKFYERIVPEVVRAEDPTSAEMAKLLENVFRKVNIGLINELKTLCDPIGLDIWEVIRLASTKPFGFMPFYPGPGLGGHCIPIDPFYFEWKARQHGLVPRFIELAYDINSQMPRYVAERTREALLARGVDIKGAKVLVLGVAYKEDIDDTRNSPALDVIELLRIMGASVDYHDPYVPSVRGMRSVPLEIISQYDCAIVTTAHSCFDKDTIADQCDLVVDTRNLMRGIPDYHEKVVRA